MDSSKKTCPACHGQTVVPNFQNGNPVTCPVCDGDGQVQKKYRRAPYDFAFPPVTIAGSGRQSPSLQITTDNAFEWWDTVATYTDPRVRVALEVNSAKFMNTSLPGNQDGIDLANFAGTAQLPYSRRWPYVLNRMDQVILYLTDFSTGSNRVQITFKGFQLVPES